MKPKRSILLTFDHELFLGSHSGTVEKCLLEPVDALQQIFNDFGIRGAIFFLDTTWLMRLRKESGHEFLKDFKKVQDHVEQLLDHGHRVYPHIHPHWLDAVPLGKNQWSLTKFDRYAFKNCDAALRSQIWEASISILKDFGVGRYHTIDGFRAGGWCIQPFENFRPFFEQYGIKYDFTVLPGTAARTNAQQYDFTAVQLKRPFKFTREVDEQDPNGKFIEVPISVREVPRNPSKFERLFLRYLAAIGVKSFGDGQGVLPVSESFEPKGTAKNVKMISIELMNVTNLRAYKQHLEENEFVHFISHPKMLTGHNLKMFRKYLTHASEKFTLDFGLEAFVKE